MKMFVGNFTHSWPNQSPSPLVCVSQGHKQAVNKSSLDHNIIYCHNKMDFIPCVFQNNFLISNHIVLMCAWYVCFSITLIFQAWSKIQSQIQVKSSTIMTVNVISHQFCCHQVINDYVLKNRKINKLVLYGVFECYIRKYGYPVIASPGLSHDGCDPDPYLTWDSPPWC